MAWPTIALPLRWPDYTSQMQLGPVPQEVVAVQPDHQFREAKSNPGGGDAEAFECQRNYGAEPKKKAGPLANQGAGSAPL